MITIDRRNILELIGKDSSKYHSCILTCYNFDFSFFEERVLPILRTANVKNINILADGYFLEQAQEMTSGKEFKHNKTYNFSPVYEEGVFHPKILFLTGKNHGLLIIGSGNITSSGLSTNDEIWGAFHLDNTANENAALFADIWSYLQRFTTHMYGFVPEKIEWIKKYSPWLENLPKGGDKIELESLKQSVQFFCNHADQSIYQQLYKSIPKYGLERLTVISPYFDKKGLVLKQLLQDFNPKTFKCIVDTNSGLLPTNLEDEIMSKISFYDWINCRNDYTKDVNRLHAKLLHFNYADGLEYLFLGSANVSIQALGSMTNKAKNAEAGILLSRYHSSNWLDELKIKFPTSTISHTEMQEVKGLNSESLQRVAHKYRILYTELRGNEINCYTNSEVNDPIYMVTMSRQGVTIETIYCHFSGNEIFAKCVNPETVFKIFLTNSEGKKLSNYSIVHRVESLLRCNPDPAQEKLNNLLGQEYPNGEGVTSLLEFVDYDWADDEGNSTSDQTIITGHSHIKHGTEKKKTEFKILPKDEFNKVSHEVFMKQNGVLTNANVKIAEFLHLITSDNSNKDDDYQESEEQKLLEETEQKGEGKDIQTKIINKTIAQKEKRAISTYFYKLDSVYSEKLNAFYNASALTVYPTEFVTIKSSSKILIALQLILIYHGKKFTVMNDNDNAKSYEEKYLLDGHIFDKSHSVKGFLLNVLGKFLVLATAGRKHYDYEILNQKIQSNYTQLFEKALFIVMNLHWKSEEEYKYRLTILLNLHYFIEPSCAFDDALYQTIEERLESLKKKAKYISPYLPENLEYYLKEFLPYYKNWITKFKDTEQKTISLTKETVNLNHNSILFSRRIGFNYIQKLSENGHIKLDLKREGYLQTEKGYILSNITYGNKCINYL